MHDDDCLTLEDQYGPGCIDQYGDGRGFTLVFLVTDADGTVWEEHMRPRQGGRLVKRVRVAARP